MDNERDDDYEPEHDQYLDDGDDLDVIFADELAGEPADGASPAVAETELPDEDEDEFQGGLDEDY